MPSAIGIAPFLSRTQIISYSNLALDFFEIGNFNEAKFYMDNVVAVRKKTLQEDDSDLIKVVEWQKRINTALIG